MRNRGFEVVSAYKDKGINIPVRKTRGSAAYDIEAAEDIVIPPYQQGIKPTLIPTGLKAYCRSDEFYILANRSSGPKKGFVMANRIGIIDSDYYNALNEKEMGRCIIIEEKYAESENLIKALCSIRDNIEQYRAKFESENKISSEVIFKELEL